MQNESYGQTWVGSQLSVEDLRVSPITSLEHAQLIQIIEDTNLTERTIDSVLALRTHVDALVPTWSSRLKELEAGRGFLVLSGLPIDPLSSARLYLVAIGYALGIPVLQNRKGELIVSVESTGADVENTFLTGHRSRKALGFHSDKSDLTALLCVRQANTGGETKLISSLAVYETLAKEAPQALEILRAPFPYDQGSDERRGDASWVMHPIFSVQDGIFVTRYIRRFIESSQRYDDAPRLSDGQWNALQKLTDILDRPEMSVQLTLKPGELLLLNNHTVLHSRGAYEDDTVGEGRLLLRLWVASRYGRALPASFEPVFGSTLPGVRRGGVDPLVSINDVAKD